MGKTLKQTIKTLPKHVEGSFCTTEMLSAYGKFYFIIELLLFSSYNMDFHQVQIKKKVKRENK